MARAVLLLLIIGGLVLFALQNLSPFPLVILGLQTQPLPLAMWILGAIAAGALTTLVLAGLFKASNSLAVARSRRRSRPVDAGTNQVSAAANPSWTSTWQRSEPKSSPESPSRYSRVAAASTTDDWEQRRAPVEEWEDWEGYDEAAQPTTTSQPASSSRDPRSYTNSPTAVRSESYSSSQPYAPSSSINDKEVWDDWEDEDDLVDSDVDTDADSDRIRRSEEDTYRRGRTDFEVRQEPQTRYQEGSIYSYSYRGTKQEADNSATDTVYDAEYRVLTPPYRPEAEDKSEAANDEEDWVEDGSEDDIEDDDDNQTGNPKGDR